MPVFGTFQLHRPRSPRPDPAAEVLRPLRKNKRRTWRVDVLEKVDASDDCQKRSSMPRGLSGANIPDDKTASTEERDTGPARMLELVEIAPVGSDIRWAWNSIGQRADKAQRCCGGAISTVDRVQMSNNGTFRPSAVSKGPHFVLRIAQGQRRTQAREPNGQSRSRRRASSFLSPQITLLNVGKMRITKREGNQPRYVARRWLTMWTSVAKPCLRVQTCAI